jgi:predicted HD superfamily hydrolase involved in NAD metabolism
VNNIPTASLLDREAVLQWLKANVPKPRISHILRVETYAIELARQHRLDIDATAKAAFLHDLAKYFSPERLLTMAQQEGLPIDSVEERDPRLLHAEVSAIVARDEFKIQDTEILDAIRNHTLGRSPMSPISCVVFLADSLEPGRGDHANLNRIRKVSKSNLYEAVGLTCDRTLHQLIDCQMPIHPRVILTRNWAIEAAKDLALR